MEDQTIEADGCMKTKKLKCDTDEKNCVACGRLPSIGCHWKKNPRWGKHFQKAI